jgi:uncharacterized protein YdeI (BOF family)
MTRSTIPMLAGIALSAWLAAPLLAATSGKTDATVSTLAPGQTVTLAGTVERITDEDEFLLRDATGTVLVYVGPNLVPAQTGESITVSGFVDDDGPLEIYATAITRADGTRVELSHRY